jgi:Gas vesicle synthesis protein GvpO
VTADRKRKAASGSSPAKTPAAPAKKAPAKKGPAKKGPAKKGPAQKGPAQKSGAAKKQDAGGETSPRASAPRAESRPRPSATRVAATAMEQLTQLTGKPTEGVTGVERNDDGWRVTVEVLEVRRVPETTDLLAQYDVDTDDQGDLMGYRRVRRYTRGSAQED